MKPSDDPRHGLYIERLLIAAGVAVLLLFLWAILDLLILAFGAAVVAVLLRAISEPLRRWTPLGDRLSVAAVVLLIAGAGALLVRALGDQIGRQFAGLAQSLPAAWEDLRNRIADLPLGGQILEWIRTSGSDAGNVFSQVSGVAMMVGNAVADLLLIAFGAIFLAAQPRLYCTGVLKLLPRKARPLGQEALADSGRALRLWLLGQLVSMAIVGVLTGVGLWLAGVPLAVALGLIAGLLEIIPYAGPIVAAVPGLLIAFMEGPQTALAALLVYVVVQQIEGNLLMPIVQRKAVQLPPALTLFGIIAAGLVFGFVGFIFAAPLLVVGYVLIKRLYVREALHTPTPLPGDDEERA